MATAEASVLPAGTILSAVAYRPIVRDGQEQIEVWPSPLEIGQSLPVLPLALNAEHRPPDRPGSDLHHRVSAPSAGMMDAVVDRESLARPLGDTLETVISVHQLTRGLCAAYGFGDPTRPDAVVLQSASEMPLRNPVRAAPMCAHGECGDLLPL